MNSKIVVLIPAAGKGKRMDSAVKKPYLVLADKPVLSHTIERFEHNSAIDNIFLIVHKSDFESCKNIVIEPYNYKKVRGLIPGGETRQESVFNGLSALTDDVDYVIIHDGVRPFINNEIITKCLEAAAEWGAAVAAVPVKETIKFANEDHFSVQTPNRKLLWRVQTPQVFRKTVIETAHKSAIQEGNGAPDDATLVERLGSPVKLVMGSYKNIKITTPEDMRFAETIIHNENVKN
ncbi:2-C-methyl-D-erythritol 4-phosphate cytidylyltransferase [Candidatus Poribacteria bacterium]|nr:2-C-methyl-D-erythritol 4-phosphate cytidylyltransferase [Candidatus Poribacteria bacterium]MYF54949.1 2-C-methyl-D-erythritol 4-phosphate cytidylyltransferase [Candidatus Poribacteria bacterium]MYI94187.1 2-C-methyl-D-erythritol 4-phosphate cytidylyltransferase [Candidatus Poribacteria bacterium]